MKRILSIVCAAALLFMTACGQTGQMSPKAGMTEKEREAVSNVAADDGTQIVMQIATLPTAMGTMAFEDNSSVDENATGQADLKNLSVGQIITFGHYEQDGNLSNGKEPIEWEVLELVNGCVLVVSRYVLDAVSYNDTYEHVIWENCSLRYWLNHDFYDAAFSKEEQEKIPLVGRRNYDYENFQFVEREYTSDQIFALSLDEVLEYYSFSYHDENANYYVSEQLMIEPTAYAVQRGVHETTISESTYAAWKDKGLSEESIGKKVAKWWLRTPSASASACSVGTVGMVGEGCRGNVKIDGQPDGCQGVRPAMYVEIASYDADQQKGPDPRIGKLYRFGHYEQDNDPDNGEEMIDWIILDVDGEGNLLLISRYVLDCQFYNQPVGKKLNDVTWETCALREWLNGEFYNTAFEIKEQDKILTTTVAAENNEVSGVKAGKDTEDKVYLLSVNEARKYFENDDTEDGRNYGFSKARATKPTDYAMKHKAMSFSEQFGPTEWDGNTGWYLRTPGNTSKLSAVVAINGKVIENNTVFYGDGYGIRPVIWVTP